jgi:anti-sigma-K factor RskA
MNPVGPSHGRYEELAAGYALDALESEDLADFEAHLASCSSCQAEVASYREVLAQLSLGLEGEAPPPQLKERILAAALADLEVPPAPPAVASGVVQESQGRVVPLRPRTRWPRWLVAVAALVVALVGVGLGFWLSGGSPLVPPAQCVAARGCEEVVMASTLTHRKVGVVMLVEHRAVWIEPSKMAPDDVRSEIYVLWALVGHSSPTPIGGFELPHSAQRALFVGNLPSRLAKAGTFAVSLEPGHKIPRKPSRVVAVGSVI